MMKFILLLIITRDVFAYGSLLISSNSLKMENRKNICGGKAVGKHQSYGHQISLRYGKNHTRTKHICGGSIVSRNAVVTAAHCVKNKPPRNFYVVAGITNLTDVGQKYLVKNISCHDSYKFETYIHDIAILITEKEIEYGPSVKPIPLYKGKVEAGKPCVTTGWGVNTLNGPLVPLNTLQELTTFTITAEECTDHQPNRTYVINDEIEICTLRDVGMGFCKGDSGGPLVYEQQLAGIVSWTRNCATGFPDVFTNVSAYAGWIKKVFQKYKLKLDC